LQFWGWIRKDTTEATAQANVIRSAGPGFVDEVEENAKNSHCCTHGEAKTITLHGPPSLFILESESYSHICIVVYERESNYLTTRTLVNDITGFLHVADTFLSIRMELIAKMFQGSLYTGEKPRNLMLASEANVEIERLT